MASQVLVVLTFQTPSGNPLSNGSITLRLQQDVSANTTNGPQVSAGRLIEVSLDSTGTGIFELWLVGMSPSPVYFVEAYTSDGQPVWQGTVTIDTSLSSYILLEDGSLIYLESGAPAAILTEVQ
jgi:hypothetical protein